jgi:polysaccharide pyruvyl transferase WcaK-like protein
MTDSYMPFTLHIGFDFWGAGNLGDDLMLAGFQHWIDANKPDCHISALCAHDIGAMRLRFPKIEWFASDANSRAQALKRADAWIGLGGGVFQIEVGTWILDQMLSAMEAAKVRGIPSFLVGVGVNNRAALLTEQAQKIRHLARGIWLRDALCLDLALDCGFSTGNTKLGADTAHLYCAAHRGLPLKQGAALVIHADLDRVTPAIFARAREDSCMPWSWVCQEVRPIPDSESLIYDKLLPAFHTALPLIRPDYAQASIAALHEAVAQWDCVLSSRFHTSLAAAWSGARLAIFERNDKLRAIRHDLGCERCASLEDASEIARALGAASRVEEPRLQACLTRADSMLGSLFEQLA